MRKRTLLALPALLLATTAFYTCSADSTEPDRYTWYPVASVDSLTAILNRTGPSILKVQRDTLWVIPQIGMGARLMTDSNPPVDDSRKCPPTCP